MRHDYKMNNAAILLLIVTLISCEKSDIVIDDFESGLYDKWQVEGDAFGEKPVSLHF